MGYVEDIERKRRRYYDVRLKEELGSNPDDPRHGTTSAYSRGGCRCTRCRDAASRYNASRRERKVELKAKNLEAMRNDPEDKRHGTRTGYGIGCRCERCSGADRKARNAARLELETNPDDPRHGTYAGAVAKCSCEPCRSCSAWYNRARRKPDGEAASRVYTCYFGDIVKAVGTMDEIADAIHRKVETVNLYSKKRYQEEHPDGWAVV